MHNNHISATAIRARLRRAIDPCQIEGMALVRDGEVFARGEAWRYRKGSFSAALAMALSGVISQGDGTDMALLLALSPEDAVAEAGDEAVFTDRTGGITMRSTVVGATRWPLSGPAAYVTLTLKAVEE